MDPAIDRLQREAAEERAISLAGGLPAPETFPAQALAAAASRTLRDEGDRALQYDWPEGREELRRFVASRLRARGADVTPEEVLITSGAQQALAVAAELLLESKARAVALDAESYPGAIDLLRRAGASLGVRCPAPLAFRYCMPALGNPHGRAATAVERAALLAGAILVEDDAYAELRWDGAPPPPLLVEARDRVWHCGTFSKTLCPGLRLGWLVPPARLRDEALERKRLLDLQTNGLTQSIVASWLARTDFDRRLGRLRKLYQRRATRLAQALRRHLPEWRFAEPEGGFSIWAEAPDEGSATDLLRRAVEAGVSFDPGELFRVEAGGPCALRLCYSLEPEERLEEGVRRLACAWRAAWRH